MSSSVNIGHTFDEGSDWGPLNNKPVFEKYKEYLKIAKEENLELLFGGNLQDKPGYWAEPTAFVTEHSKGSRLVKEEIFGPILVIMPFSSEDEAI